MVLTTIKIRHAVHVDSMVVKRVTWPHEVVYSAAGKPAAYEDLSIPLFIKGYRIVMKGEEGAIKDKMATHLEELMADTELYGWQRVRAYHRVWLKQREQGWATWQDEDVKLTFQHALIWHPVTSASAAVLYYQSVMYKATKHLLVDVW